MRYDADELRKRVAAETGKPIPEGLILTKDGRSTTDPGEIWTDAMIDELKRCPPAEGAKEILYPGELEWRREAKAKAEGFDLPEASEKELMRAMEMVK